LGKNITLTRRAARAASTAAARVGGEIRPNFANLDEGVTLEWLEAASRSTSISMAYSTPALIAQWGTGGLQPLRQLRMIWSIVSARRRNGGPATKRHNDSLASSTNYAAGSP